MSEYQPMFLASSKRSWPWQKGCLLKGFYWVAHRIVESGGVLDLRQVSRNNSLNHAAELVWQVNHYHSSWALDAGVSITLTSMPGIDLVHLLLSSATSGPGSGLCSLSYLPCGVSLLNIAASASKPERGLSDWCSLCQMSHNGSRKG